MKRLHKKKKEENKEALTAGRAYKILLSVTYRSSVSISTVHYCLPVELFDIYGATHIWSIMEYKPDELYNCHSNDTWWHYRVPGENKRREVELDPQVSPEKSMSMSREVELGCESRTSFASGCSSTAVQRALFL